MSAARASAPAAPDAWLADIARSIGSALKAGAVRIADPAGCLVLVRPDGRHLTVSARIVEQLVEAGLLSGLPEPADVPAVDDPVELAEREAIENETRLPPVGTPARAELDQRQAEMVAGLLEASRVRPSCFEGEARRPPPQGSFCSACRSRQWWFPTRPKTDGTGPSGHWRCTTCRPPTRLREDQIVEVVT
jgi:hypothetical protein